MAISIAQAQSSLLSSGDLDNIGSARGKTLDLSETERALVRAAAKLIEQAQSNLQRSGRVSSGNLASSFTAGMPEDGPNGIKLDISAAPYFDFPNKGVKGTRGGSSSAGYSFRSSYPSEAMVRDIEKWLSRAKSVTANSSKSHSVSKHESKNNTISQYDRAYAVARAIKVKGIRGSGYLDKAIEIAQRYAEDELGTALAIDIVNALPDKI